MKMRALRRRAWLRGWFRTVDFCGFKTYVHSIVSPHPNPRKENES